MRKHWYILHITFCPVCGDEKRERERVYGERPKDELRYRVSEVYDYCDVFG